MQLPIDCIESILDELDATTRVRDLVALLTVSRVFFYASAKRLYANPIQVLSRFDQSPIGGNARMRYQAAHRLLTLVLRYSPAQDPDVQSLRLCLSSELNDLPANPTVDYLSFIKTLHYDELSLGLASVQALSKSLGLTDRPQCIAKSLYTTLTWAACSHHLSNMLDIEVLWDDLDRYQHCVDNMTSMRSIRIRTQNMPFRSPHAWTSPEKETAQGMLNAILRFMEKWAKAYCKLGPARQRPSVDIQLANDNDSEWWMSKPYSHALQRIFALMPISTLAEISTLNDLVWARFYLAPETFDVSYVHTFAVCNMTTTPDERSKWPEQVTIATILQRFRNLRRLVISMRSAIGYDLFQWAHEERQRAVTASKSSTGTDSLVPLSELLLTFYKNVSWQSAIYGFGATLTTVKISAYGGSQVDLCIFHEMPHLQCLDIMTDYIVNRRSATPFSGCPRLEILALESEHNRNHLFDPWDLPRLKRLSMSKCLYRMFHQATLKTMLKLEDFYISHDPFDDPNLSSQTAPSFVWDMDVWTQVSFPALKKLDLHGALARGFAWKMLDQCPALQHLELTACRLYYENRIELDTQRWLWPLTPRPTLLKLILAGFEIPQQPYVDGLPQVVPNLYSLELLDCVDLDVAQQNTLAAKFPRLEKLRII